MPERSLLNSEKPAKLVNWAFGSTISLYRAAIPLGERKTFRLLKIRQAFELTKRIPELLFCSGSAE